MILDTSFLLDLMRSHEAAIEKAVEIESQGVPANLSAVSVYELYYGVERFASDTERERVDRVLDKYPIIDPNRPIMQKAGRIDAALDRSGQPLDDLADVIIGATGAIRGEAVLTRNLDHFERMRDVDVTTY